MKRIWDWIIPARALRWTTLDHALVSEFIIGPWPDDG